MLRPKFIVLLQGPVGPFFSELAQSLLARGDRVLKINFNLGDRLYSRRIPFVMFSDSLTAWRGWFSQFLLGQKPDKVILFGDQRPYHQVAVALCRELGVDVWCLEEGYLRPDYVTAEREGNNAASLLPRVLSAYDRNKVASVEAPVTIPATSFKPMAWWAFKYYLAMSAGSVVFRQYSHHRERSLLGEAVLWSRNAVRKYTDRWNNAKKIIDLVDNFDRKYFVAALQVHDDLQLRVHGAGWTMERMIEATIRSFAKHAPPGTRLAFKAHPLDRGHRPYHRFVAQLARLAGVADRVSLIDDGPTGLLIRHARGMITVNSTTGILALQRNCPVFVLGNAHYAIDGLVAHGDEDKLKQFWSAPFLPNAAARDAFISHMVTETQINGSYYLSRYFDLTIRNLIGRIDDNVVELPKKAPVRVPKSA
ncbi:capsular biosynthesis protein [Labrys sp. LIt4]|uniref:capsule biosynthesis protein n=1 Tax=Labrys sp. LIt4 TaxID=2821355 RepID=UPI001ADEE8B7|nr:capsular biosynthesis protein [Labrys sp. LIt4]MBP0579789.1 capsular biosynthesis protein [Labrys sp. LIt4]